MEKGADQGHAGEGRSVADDEVSRVVTILRIEKTMAGSKADLQGGIDQLLQRGKWTLHAKSADELMQVLEKISLQFEETKAIIRIPD